MDIMIEGQAHMNRALDGDTVLVQLDPVKQWPELQSKDQTSAAGNGKAGYSNDQAIETRIVDAAATEEGVEEHVDTPMEDGDRPKEATKNQETAVGIESNNTDGDKQAAEPIEPFSLYFGEAKG